MSSITSFCITKCQYATWYSHQQGTFGYAIQPYLKSANIQIQYIDCLIRSIYQLYIRIIYKAILSSTSSSWFFASSFPCNFQLPQMATNWHDSTGHRSTGSQGARDFRLDLIRSAENMRILKPCFSFTPQNPQMRLKVFFLEGEGKVLVAKS